MNINIYKEVPLINFMAVENIKTNLSQQQIKNQSRKTLDNSSKDSHLFRLDNVLESGFYLLDSLFFILALLKGYEFIMMVWFLTLFLHLCIYGRLKDIKIDLDKKGGDEI